MSIPRIIHYCNFGPGSDAKSLDRLQKSISQHCHDYEIIVWNETNFDINYNQFTKQASLEEKWAFVSDVCRLYALYKYGGIYLDTDVEIIRSLDSLLDNRLAFGFESKNRICTAVIASEPSNMFIGELLDIYNKLEFSLTPNVELVTNKLVEHGLKLNNKKQTIDDITILPQDYLSPKNYYSGNIFITSNTLTIHNYLSSWKSKEEITRDSLFFRYKKVMPEKFAWHLASYLAALKHRGVIRSHKDILRFLKRKDKL